MKIKEEMNMLKDEEETLNNKLAEKKLEQVFGGTHFHVYTEQGSMTHAPKIGESLVEDEIKPSFTEAWFGTTG